MTISPKARRTFKDPNSFARINGESALALEVSKRSGANIIETIESVRSLVDTAQTSWPDSISITYLQDKSEQIRSMLGDLENNVITAILLVMIVIIAALGVRPAILVGLAIPGSFLAGMMVIQFMGYTLNMIVLFSLILVVGMLVDGAIVTIELADRKIAEGEPAQQAYANASKRMAWPIISSTATTLAVFIPLLFWPGMAGEFMKFLPITVIITLIASLSMALIFIPVLGGILNKNKTSTMAQTTENKAIEAAEKGDLHSIGGLVGGYLKSLERVIRHPGKSLGIAVVFLVAGYSAYILFGRGVEFFPAIEPEFLQVQVQARGDLSIFEKDQLVREVENRLLNLPDLQSVYARTYGGGAQNQGNMPADVIGVIQLELINWQLRSPAKEIVPIIRNQAATIPGITVQVREQESGPSSGKPIQIEISANNQERLANAVQQVRKILEDIGGFVDVEDSRPLPSIEWRLEVNREKAAQYGADVTLLGNTVTMLTNGVMLAEYRPNDVEDELEIRLRFPKEDRNLDQLKNLRVPTANGPVPISHFVTFKPAQKTGQIRRVDSKRIMTVKASLEPGLLAADQVEVLKTAFLQTKMEPGVFVEFKGQDQDIQETMTFLSNAFITALFLMMIILVTQFNSFYQAFLVLSAIIFSTAGVLLGLLFTGQAFGVVMGGIGIIALAGIVVNNNIVLIDTFNDLRTKGLPPTEAILRTAAQRMRPVLLTSITTVLGLLPMMFALTINVIGRDISIGAPSAQWWTQLASTIVGGLTFATILTLFLTPCLLMLGENFRKKEAVTRTE